MIGDLLTLLALSYPELRRSIFDPVNRELSRDINIAHNGALLKREVGIDTRLNDGDRLTFVPLYMRKENAGGQP